jgi:hypothetical protein
VIEGHNLNWYGSSASPLLQGYERKAAFFLYPDGVLNMGWRDPGDDTVAAPGEPASCSTVDNCNHSMDHSGMEKLWEFWNEHAGLNLP